MIYTLTLNPSIDFNFFLDEFHEGSLNRYDDSYYFPGGKGINVSRVLHQLNVPATALGFLGDFTGAFIESALTDEGISHQFTPINATTRINLKMKSHVETEINGKGPLISTKEQTALLAQLADLTEDDTVILSGSLPNSLPADFYDTIIQQITKQGARFLLDVTGEPLQEALPYQPFLIKPNHHELADLYQTTFTSVAEMIPYGQDLQAKGAQHVIISLGGDGSLFFTENKVYQALPIKGELINSVGAGDSMVAGFLAGVTLGYSPLESFKLAVASGTATAFAADLATKTEIEAMLKQVKINSLTRKEESDEN